MGGVQGSRSFIIRGGFGGSRVGSLSGGEVHCSFTGSKWQRVPFGVTGSPDCEALTPEGRMSSGRRPSAAACLTGCPLRASLLSAGQTQSHMAPLPPQPLPCPKLTCGWQHPSVSALQSGAQARSCPRACQSRGEVHAFLGEPRSFGSACQCSSDFRDLSPLPRPLNEASPTRRKPSP